MSGPKFDFEERERLVEVEDQAVNDPEAVAVLVVQLEQQRSRLADELRIIAEADPSKWDEDMRDQFREWAQNRARAALREAGVTE